MTQESPTRIVARPRPKAPVRRARTSEKRPLIYLASPILTYTTPRYDRMLELAQAAFPQSELLPARGLYISNEHWLATWPEHLRRITAVVFFPDTDRSVGKGVVTELADCRARGLPVHLLRDDGSLVEYERLRLDLIDGGLSWRRYASVSIRHTPKKASSIHA